MEPIFHMGYENEIDIYIFIASYIVMLVCTMSNIKLKIRTYYSAKIDKILLLHWVVSILHIIKETLRNKSSPQEPLYCF